MPLSTGEKPPDIVPQEVLEGRDVLRVARLTTGWILKTNTCARCASR
jgi:hypothetical protein